MYLELDYSMAWVDVNCPWSSDGPGSLVGVYLGA